MINKKYINLFNSGDYDTMKIFCVEIHIKKKDYSPRP